MVHARDGDKLGVIGRCLAEVHCNKTETRDWAVIRDLASETELSTNEQKINLAAGKSE
jgi:hypothetical protein